MSAMTCDACDFPCEARHVDGAWQFLCDLCAFIACAELEARIAPESRTMTADEYASEKMTAFDATLARMRRLLASIETCTARLKARA